MGYVKPHSVTSETPSKFATMFQEDHYLGNPGIQIVFQRRNIGFLTRPMTAMQRK